MKIMSISDIAISAIESEDKIKLMILREKWKELFSDLAEISTVIDFNEKNIYNTFEEKIPAINAPTIPPAVVNISRSIPTLILLTWSLTNAIADPLLVAITATILAPIAYFISIPNKIVKAGVIIIPPPIPTSDPKNPASIAITINCKISTIITSHF